jgi:hypothetical protein
VNGVTKPIVQCLKKAPNTEELKIINEEIKIARRS